MKNYLTFIFFLFFLADCQQKKIDYIIIKHVGESDKPLFPLKIATSFTSADSLKIDQINLQVTTKTLNTIANLNIESKSGKMNKTNNFGCFQLTISIENEIENYYLFPRSKSQEYFIKLKNSLESKKEKELISYIDMILSRIDI